MAALVKSDCATAPGRGSSVGLDEKVRFLSSPSAYPDAPQSVQAIETHMSWVFLTSREAYKLKKPVKTPFLDFSTPQARRSDCIEEVRLNSRLAPDVYLGVNALTFAQAAGLSLDVADGAGERTGAVDWLVRMRRLPGERMMDRVILRGVLTPAHVESLGERLAAFHAGLPPADIGPDAYLSRFINQHAINMDVLKRSWRLHAGALLDDAAAAVLSFLDSDADMLRVRAAQGEVVEGHGDLRPEHVCLTAAPVVIDCLEFNRLLRLVDPFEEIVCLGLECARLGAGWVGEKLLGVYESTLDMRPNKRLLAFHTVSRALLRAQLSITRLDDPGPHPPEYWRQTAGSYLVLARDAVRTLRHGGR